MGCASSKHHKRCLHCRRGYSPVDVPRSHSVHHQPQNSEDSYHMVALSSSSLGSLKLCDSSFGNNHKHLADFTENLVSGDESRISANGFGSNVVKEKEKEKEKSNLEMQAKLMEAKVWSSMMNDKIPKIVPKTPIVTPPGEPETINTWEMMDGLEDVISPLRSPNHVRSFSFDVSRNGDCEGAKCNGNVKPLWLQMEEVEEEEEEEEEEGGFEDFDPEIISSFRKSLQELPSDHPFHISIHDLELNPKMSFCDEEKDETLSVSKEKVILYFTSLRGIRKTYEESCDVRILLKSLGIRVDERDVSMHSGFKEELKELLGDKFNNGVGINLPRVFLGKKYLGGAEEIRKLNEDGKLEKLLEGCEKVDENKISNGQECETCGDIRFVPCETCSGSCKVYYEFEDEDDEEEDDDDDDRSVKEEREYGFQTCPDCNENGLIRCPLCCD